VDNKAIKIVINDLEVNNILYVKMYVFLYRECKTSWSNLIQQIYKYTIIFYYECWNNIIMIRNFAYVFYGQMSKTLYIYNEIFNIYN